VGTILLVILINTTGFLFGGGLLHWLYYRRQKDTVQDWKIQPTKFQTVRQMVEKLPLVMVNLLIISTFMGAGVYFLQNGYTRAVWTIDSWTTVLATLALFPWYHFMLYYVHRTMHKPRFFRKIHYLHHKYKVPIWLDALYEHPIEAVWGGIVLMSPLFIFPCWGYGYYIYLSVVGLHEILDHAGIRIHIPILSSARAHDDHHRWSNRYYGQLLPWLDWWHGTDGGNRRD
jgi:sterol desaturase/sphingolipid hydroxylase (fatty acid hydroxylase superfamily)